MGLSYINGIYDNANWIYNNKLGLGCSKFESCHDELVLYHDKFLLIQTYNIYKLGLHILKLALNKTKSVL